METQEFKTKVQAIGEALKMSVILGSDEDMRWNKFAHLIGSDGQEIQVQNGDYKTKNRLNFFGCFPKNEKGEHMHYGALPSITVAVEKSPEKIARDIEKRLLPIYLPELEKAIEQVEQSNKYHQKRQANIQKMADYFQVEFKDDGREPTIYVYEKIKGLGSIIKVCGEDTVTFELELTPEIAIKVFDLLKQ